MRSCTRLLVLVIVSVSFSGVLASEIDAALANPARPEADSGRDADRKPAQVLSFFGVESGQSVLDMFAGGGYYTEILSAIVGESGEVTSHNNQAYVDYARDEMTARYTEGRLTNVTHINQEVNDLDLGEERFDTILMVLSYHDIYFNPGDGSWPLIDGPKLLDNLCRSLKKGAVLGVVDHVAAAGSPTKTGNSLHRIDPNLARREILASGCFEFDGEADFLRNSDDDHTLPMYDPSIRGKTDRFVYRFVRKMATTEP